jgi:prepilin-type N-terminal cleavage/methylation domain-containing protein
MYNMSMSRGLTLVELLVVISVIGLLSSVVLSSVVEARKEAKEARYVVEANDLIRGINACGLLGFDAAECQPSAQSCSQLSWDARNAINTHDLLYQSCGESDRGDWQCTDNVTWLEAKNICEAEGSRLCTVEELENDITRGTGCGFDSHMIWSTSPCDGGMFISEGWNRTDVPAFCQQDLTRTTPEGGAFTNVPIAVRCCADDY